MCWHDEDGGFVDDNNIYGNEVDATIYDIRRKERQEEEHIRQIEREDEDG